MTQRSCEMRVTQLSKLETLVKKHVVKDLSKVNYRSTHKVH